MNKKTKGFTLIELLVVIAIISLLATTVMASLSSARSKARDAKRSADIRQVQTALEMYYDDNNGYISAGDILLHALPVTNRLTPTYMATIPRDPGQDNYRYYSGDSTTYYAIKIPYENKTQCWVCGGGSLCATPDPQFWGLSRCQ